MMAHTVTYSNFCVEYQLCTNHRPDHGDTVVDKTGQISCLPGF